MEHSHVRLARSLHLKKFPLPGYRKRRICLYIAGGGNLWVLAAGVVEALIRCGLSEYIDIVVTNSCGGPVGLALETPHGRTREVFEHCLSLTTSPRFINFRRWPFVDLDYFFDSFARSGHFDEERFTQSARKFRVVVSTPYGEVTLLNPKRAEPTAIAAYKASAAVQGFCSAVEVNKKRLKDGGLNSFPLRLIVNEFPKVTDIIVVTNTPEMPIDHIRASWRNVGFSLLAALLEPWVAYPIIFRHEVSRRSLKEQFPGVNVALFFAPEDCAGIEPWTMDQNLLRRARWRTFRKTVHDLSAAFKQNLIAS